ncbi:MAG: dihydroneopterin aldolase [Actinobacteria bacterium]|nr:dihydroneopterin aldolase [Actinomycetota bacterium]
MSGVRVINVKGIRAEGRHGANPGEKNEPQPFVVDVEVSVDVRSDDLGATIDYGAIASTVRDAVMGYSFELLETLAHEVARAVYGLPRVERATVVIHKPRAAEIIGVDDVSVEATVA